MFVGRRRWRPRRRPLRGPVPRSRFPLPCLLFAGRVPAVGPLFSGFMERRTDRWSSGRTGVAVRRGGRTAVALLRYENQVRRTRWSGWGFHDVASDLKLPVLGTARFAG